jgi:hypothetical protein
MDSALTLQAEKRLQQRGIPPLIFELLHQFSTTRSHGTDRLFLGKATNLELGDRQKMAARLRGRQRYG